MSFNLNETIQNILVNCLRNYFINNEDYPCILDNDGKLDIDNTSIAIYRSYPKTLTSYPTIIINSPRIPNMMRTLGGDYIGSVFGDRDVGEISTIEGLCYETYGNMGELNFTIDITGNSTTERERIADYVVHALRYKQRDYLEAQAIDILDVSKDGETIVDYGTSYLYANQVSINLFAEWGETVYPTTIIKDVTFCNINIYSDLEGLCFIDI